MKKISSNLTFTMKKIFPAMWFGFLALFFMLVIGSGMAQKSGMLLIVPTALAVFGFFLIKLLIWDLMDEVIDYGNHLIVKYHGQEDIIYLTNIMNISVSIQQHPPRITLRLRTAGKFGEEVAFFPITEFSINPFKKNQLAEELISRIDKARSGNISSY
jgi:hypothetical protein